MYKNEACEYRRKLVSIKVRKKGKRQRNECFNVSRAYEYANVKKGKKRTNAESV